MAACSYHIWQRGCWSSWWGVNWAIVLQRMFLSRANHNSVYKSCCTNLTWTIRSIEDTGQDSFNYPMSPWDHQGRQILSPESVCYHTLFAAPQNNCSWPKNSWLWFDWDILECLSIQSWYGNIRKQKISCLYGLLQKYPPTQHYGYSQLHLSALH